MTFDEYQTHLQEVVLPEREARQRRGGVWATIDGDSYWAPSVGQLRAAGVRVFVRHYRVGILKSLPASNWLNPPSNKGGRTHVTLLAPDGYWSEGWARCSRHDIFSKKSGYVLACFRALCVLPGQLYEFDAPYIEALENAEVSDY